MSKIIKLIGIANTPELRKQGLQNVPMLPPESGMLFMYPIPAYNRIWGKGTLIDLDVAFILPCFSDNQGVVCSIEEVKAADEKIVDGHTSTQYVLEVAAGELKRLGIKIGDRMTIADDMQSVSFS